MDTRMTYEALMVNEASKRGPKYPTMTKLCQELRVERSIKTQRSGTMRPGMPEAMVAATPVVNLPSLG